MKKRKTLIEADELKGKDLIGLINRDGKLFFGGIKGSGEPESLDDLAKRVGAGNDILAALKHYYGWFAYSDSASDGPIITFGFFEDPRNEKFYKSINDAIEYISKYIRQKNRTQPKKVYLLYGNDAANPKGEAKGKSFPGLEPFAKWISKEISESFLQLINWDCIL